METAETKLSDRPDWCYVIREYYNVYRFGMAGGSKRIGGHMRTVQSRLSQVLTYDTELMIGAPERKPVCDHLGRSLGNGEQEKTQTFIRAIEKISPELSWQYGYGQMPTSLKKNYAYAEILGPNGPVVCNDLILGLVLFSPNCKYPAHSHHDITESYYCLSGHVSQNHAGVYPPGSMLFNQSGFEHLITTSLYEPVLLAYVWVGDAASLGGFEMTFTKKKRT
jgi:dimethylpropiothetin dethiomethylase